MPEANRKIDDAFLDQLASDATAVATTGARLFASYLGTGALLSAAIIIFISNVRVDITDAAATPIFLWKLGATMAIAVCALMLLYRVGRPGAPTRRGLQLTVASAVILLLTPLGFAFLTRPAGAVMTDISPGLAISCISWTSAAAVPIWFAALAWLRRAAPTHLTRASWAAGLASASVGATFFVLHCPYDQVAYVSVWYGTSILAISALTRLVLPRLIRW